MSQRRHRRESTVTGEVNEAVERLWNKVKRPEVALVALLIMAALIIRLLTYQKLAANINNDEFAWAWAGQGIWTHGKPEGWSYLAGYQGSGVMPNPVTGLLLPWQQHWVDHPPLFAVLVGFFEKLTGQLKPADASIAVIRLAPIL